MTCGTRRWSGLAARIISFCFVRLMAVSPDSARRDGTPERPASCVSS
jgi:hypothetical protein